MYNPSTGITYDFKLEDRHYFKSVSSVARGYNVSRRSLAREFERSDVETFKFADIRCVDIRQTELITKAVENVMRRSTYKHHPIGVISKSGEILRSFDSVPQAAEHYGIDPCRIYSVLDDQHRTTANGRIFKYVSRDRLKVLT